MVRTRVQLELGLRTAKGQGRPPLQALSLPGRRQARASFAAACGARCGARCGASGGRGTVKPMCVGSVLVIWSHPPWEKPWVMSEGGSTSSEVACDQSGGRSE